MASTDSMSELSNSISETTTKLPVELKVFVDDYKAKFLNISLDDHGKLNLLADKFKSSTSGTIEHLELGLALTDQYFKISDLENAQNALNLLIHSVSFSSSLTLNDYDVIIRILTTFLATTFQSFNQSFEQVFHVLKMAYALSFSVLQSKIDSETSVSNISGADLISFEFLKFSEDEIHSIDDVFRLIYSLELIIEICLSFSLVPLVIPFSKYYNY
ncbi:hypothetical protein GEMRC1_010202 [Eukaryota sp. GEM-RC1]